MEEESSFIEEEQPSWVKNVSCEVIGPSALQGAINQYASTYYTNIIASKINPKFQRPYDKYTVEVWYNFKAHCNIIIAFYTNTPEETITIA